MIGMFALMIIPQRKREKKIKDMLAAIKVGDRVRTIGGIYGTVSALRDDIVTLTVGPDKVRLVFARGAIANVENVPVEATMDDGRGRNQVIISPWGEGQPVHAFAGSSEKCIPCFCGRIGVAIPPFAMGNPDGPCHMQGKSA